MENKPLIDPLVDEATKAFLRPLYAAPERHYHGLSHIEALLDLAAEHRPLLADPDAVDAAIWFHDAIYDSRAADNETRSAALAREKLAGRTDPARIERITAMIEATATHALPDLTDERYRADAALFLDMDLSVLGAPPAAFDAYEAAVRREYAWVPEPAWRQGRAAVLRRFLQRETIFQTDAFRQRFETPARDNIARSLRALDAS